MSAPADPPRTPYLISAGVLLLLGAYLGLTYGLSRYRPQPDRSAVSPAGPVDPTDPALKTPVTELRGAAK